MIILFTHTNTSYVDIRLHYNIHIANIHYIAKYHVTVISQCTVISSMNDTKKTGSFLMYKIEFNK